MQPLTLIDLLILAVSAVLIISKFLDCTTTHKYIKQSQETNPIGAFFMQLFGRKTAIWAIFTFVLLIVGASVAYYFLYPNLFYGISFVLLGTIISVFQFAVAHANYNFGQHREVSNPVIRLAERLHHRLGRMKIKR